MNRAYLLLILVTAVGCNSTSQRRPSALNPPESTTATKTRLPKNPVPVVHVFVALCDNVNQGIVPVAAPLGNGDDPARNLYWGAGFGVKTFFINHKNWQLVDAVGPSSKSSSVVLDRVVFKHRKTGAFLVAEAYRGRYIKQATEDFLAATAGEPGEALRVNVEGKPIELDLGGNSNLIVYVGHDGLMDFHLSSSPRKRDEVRREAIVLACASKAYFAESLRATGAEPLLWTTNLMAPEAYILSAAVEGWLNHETGEQIRMRAAQAYDQYQHCGTRSASALFATGW